MQTLTAGPTSRHKSGWLSVSLSSRDKGSFSAEQDKRFGEIQDMIRERQNIFFEMEAYLPKKNG